MQIQRPFAALTPTVDGDVLGVLSSSYADYTVAQLASLIPDRSPNGIRQALERLAEQGIVATRDAGRTRTYSLNDAHLLAHAVRDIAGAASALIERLRSAVVPWVDPPVFGAIFGSAARREMRTDSDLDILLVRSEDADEGAWQHNVAQLTRQATEWTGNDARIVDLDRADLASSPHRPLLEAVSNEGLAFAGDVGWLGRVLAGGDR